MAGSETNNNSGGTFQKPHDKTGKESASIPLDHVSEEKSHPLNKKHNRPRLSRQHILASPALFLHPEYQDKLDLPIGTLIMGLIMEVASNKNGQRYIINWDDTNLPLGLSSIHLRQKVEKTNATYRLLVEARQRHQDQGQTPVLAADLRLKDPPALKSPIVDMTVNNSQKSTSLEVEETGKAPATSSNYSPAAQLKKKTKALREATRSRQSDKRQSFPHRMTPRQKQREPMQPFT